MDPIRNPYAPGAGTPPPELAGRDPILFERRGGPLPRYQVRIGAQTRAAANDLCKRIHNSGGDCVVLRNSRG